MCTDTRSLQAGDLFVALHGERFDAHQFLHEAADKQACGLVGEKEDPDIPLPQLVVSDTTQALGQLAGLNRELFDRPVIAVTGSGGKTTVKTLLRNILAARGVVYATRGNLNNHIGVPLSLFELGLEHEYAVIEMGASGPGEIGYLTQLAKPDIGVVTNALRAHVEGFGSVEGVARAKGELFTGLRVDGTAIVNLDDPAVNLWLEQIGERRRITFSAKGSTADIGATEIVEAGDGRIKFTLQVQGAKTPVSLQLMGRHNVANALAAAACAHAVGLDCEAIKSGLESSEAVAGRMQIRPGIGGATVIDDSYNANPDSVTAAVNSLSQLPRNTILVLGDMGELGSDAVRFHRDLGVYARTAGIDCLVTVGSLTRNTSEEFGEGAHHFESHQQAITFLQEIIDTNTVLLIKGSRSAHMEHVVAALTISGEQ
ncbi:MAG: UDP-N-acetylmuramoyl-tripeptide--D-alanyl-D-alanine ligase [Cellvibrionaceae bacterium]